MQTINLYKAKSCGTMEIEDISILNMINDYGLSNFFRSRDFALSLFLSFLVSVLVYYLNWKISDLINILAPIFITTAGVFLTVVLAGLAIIVSMSDPNFIKLLMKINVYFKLLIVFYWTALVSSVCIIANIFTYLINEYMPTNLHELLTIILFFSILTFFYSLLSVVAVLGITVQYGAYWGVLINSDSDKVKELLK